MKWILLLLTIPLYAQTLETNILELKNATPQEVERVNRSLELIEQVVGSDAFRERVLTMKYKIKKRSFEGFSQTDLSPAEILEGIYKAQENFSGGTEGVMDLNLRMYNEYSNTVGYTSPSDRFIHLNRYVHDDYTVAKSAGNIFHEWLHKLDHDHYGNKHNRYRPHSVPYKLGDVVAEMIADVVSEGDPVLKSMLLENSEINCNH